MLDFTMSVLRAESIHGIAQLMAKFGISCWFYYLPPLLKKRGISRWITYSNQYI